MGKGGWWAVGLGGAVGLVAFYVVGFIVLYQLFAKPADATAPPIKSDPVAVAAAPQGQVPLRQQEPAPRETAPKERADDRVDMTLPALLAQRPTEPRRIRVQASLDTYYNSHYSDTASTHYSFELWYRSPTTVVSAHAYIRRDSPLAQRIFDYLKDGERHFVTLKVVLQGPDGQPTPPNQTDLAIVE